MHTKKPPSKKMDRYLVSQQTHEIRYVRTIFYKMQGEKIVHPTVSDIKALVKSLNNSRKKIYAILRSYGYTQIRHK